VSELTLRVSADAGSGMRLDRYCALKSGEVSRSRLKNGALSATVNGKAAKLSRAVRPGDLIVLAWEDPVPERIEPENIPLRILYEDANVTVVDKPQGMVTHPAAGNWTGTLVHALMWHWGLAGGGENPRPGIVHRLDKDTSGIIITARNPETETFLQEQFRTRKTVKVYAAILSGVPRAREGEIKTRITRDPKNRKRFTWTDDESRGKHARTAYRVVKTYGPYALVLFRLHTGRTHQLRVHSKYLGCPILGDPIYGKKDKVFPDATLMLHAKRLTIPLPGARKPLTVRAPLPRRFRGIISKLRELYGP